MTRFAVTCGRGFEELVKEEISKLSFVSSADRIGDGKIIFETNFPLPSNEEHPCEKGSVEANKSETSDPLEDDHNIDNKCSSKLNFCISNAQELFNLKLVERLFLLLHFSILEQTTDDVKSLVLSSIKETCWCNIANIVEHVQTDRNRLSMPRYLCIDPNTCPATASRTKEIQSRTEHRNAIKNERSKLLKNKRKISDVNVSANTQLLKTKCQKVNDFSCSVKSNVSKEPLEHNLNVTDISNKSHLNVENGDQEYDDGINNIKTKLETKLSKSIDKSILVRCRKCTNTLSDKESNSNCSTSNIEFRVSCRITGNKKRLLSPIYTSKEISNIIIAINPHWTLNEQSGDSNLLDIFVNVTDNYIFIGCCLVEKPLSLRPYLRHINLRSTVCQLLIRFAEPLEGGILLDPMCGIGSILTEAAHCIKLDQIIGVDIDSEQLTAATCNMTDAPSSVSLIMGDAAKLPLKICSVDSIVCDFPFGYKYKSRGLCHDNLLKKCISECARVLKKGGKISILLSSPQEEYLKQIYNEALSDPSELDLLTLLKLKSSQFITLGRTPAFVCSLQKHL